MIPKTILLAHGGNANAWLIENVNWSSKNWAPTMIPPTTLQQLIQPRFDWQNEKLT